MAKKMQNPLNGPLKNPRDWSRYSQKNCKTCWAACCTLPVEMSVPDLIRLGFCTEGEAAESLQQVGRKLLKEGWIQRFSQKTQVFVLAQKPSNDCVFLNEARRCTRYEDRPQVCRKFPSSVGPRVGFCPKWD